MMTLESPVANRISCGHKPMPQKTNGQPLTRWRPVILCIVLMLGVWIVFGQTLRHEFVNADDDVYVTENVHVAAGLTSAEIRWAFTNLQAGFWHPLTWLSLMADAQVHGLRAGGFHFTNVLLHALNTTLLFGLLRRMTGSHWRSAFVAALFAVHPLHVESVAWISERKGLLSTCFFLLSLWAYASYAQDLTGEQLLKSADGKRPIRPLSHRVTFYLLALLCFTCGLMSKTMVVTLPLVMLLLDYWPLGRLNISTFKTGPSSFRRLVWEKTPFFCLALAAGWLTLRAEKDIGALAQGESLPMQLRLANAAISNLRYVSQTVWPTDLTVFYPSPTSFPTGLVLSSLLLLGLISLAAIWFGRRYPYLLAGWLWYLITLAPVSGLIQVGGHARADRYTYIPLIGIFLLVSWGLAKWCGSWRFRRKVLGLTGVAVVIGLLIVAQAQTTHWRDSVSLWTHALACAPDNPEARHNLGDALAAQGQWPEAARQYERALQLKPDHVLAHDALGVALASQGRLDEAISHFERAVQLKTNFAVGRYNLSIALASKGRLTEAMQQCEAAIRLKPDYAEAHQNLAVALASQGKMTEATSHFQQAIQLAIAQGKTALADTIRQRFALYQTNPPQSATP